MAYMKDSEGRRLDSFKVPKATEVAQLVGDNSLALYGDSITDFWKTVTTGTPAITVSQGISFHRWMQVYARERFKITNEYGVSGEYIAQILARVDAVIADPARSVFLLAGTNDITGVTLSSVATMQAGYLALWDALQGAGKRVIQATIPLARQIVTTAQRDTYDKINAWIQREAPARGVIVIPFQALWSDPADGKPHGPSQSAPWTTIDGTHPSSYGAQLLGKRAAEVLAPLFAASGDDLTYSNADSSNAISNGLMLTTGGNGQLNGVSSALVPFGYKVITSLSQTATPSIVARGDNLGNWAQLRITAGNPNDGSVRLTYDASTSPAWAVGDTLVAEVEVDTDADFVNASRLQVDLVALTAGYATLGTVQALKDTSSSQDIHRLPISGGIVRTPPLLIPATTGVLQLVVWTAGLTAISGTTATLRVGRATIHRV